MDRRRHGFPQAGHAFGRRASSVLRPAWQAGQLSGGGDAVDRQSSCQPADRLSAYLPQEWAKDAARRNKAHVPEAIAFKTKPQIALEQIRGACEAGVPRGVVLMDASYGSNSA